MCHRCCGTSAILSYPQIVRFCFAFTIPAHSADFILTTLNDLLNQSTQPTGSRHPNLDFSTFMNTRKFGGGRPPTGTPSLPLSCAIVVVSLLAGASVVHNIYKPNLTLPPVEPNPDPKKII